MPRTCTICSHAARADIDRALVAGEAFRDIAGRFGTSKTAVFRHKAHVPAALARAKDATEATRGGDLLACMRDLAAQAQRIGHDAEKSGQRDTALRAIREQMRIAEVLCDLGSRLQAEATQREAKAAPRPPMTAAARGIAIVVDTLASQADALPRDEVARLREACAIFLAATEPPGGEAPSRAAVRGNGAGTLGLA